MKSLIKLIPFLRRFKRAQKGSTAVEFAIVALPFFSLMFAIFDVSLVYFATSALENGVASAAREIRTGQAQINNLTSVQFRDLVCARIAPLMSCGNNLVIDIRKFTNFGSITFPVAVDANGNFTNNAQYQIGVAGDVIVVRAYYSWPMLTPVGSRYVTMANGKRLLTVSAAFRNEPFVVQP